MSKSKKPQPKKEQVSAHYDAAAKKYGERYERDNVYNLDVGYPSNYFRLQLLVNSFTEKKIKRVIEVGVGEGSPLITLARAGMDVYGFDIAQAMVLAAKKNMTANKFDPKRIFWADIQDPVTYANALGDGQFDGLMAMGVMPHVENDDMVLENMSKLIKPGGSVFIEFRNKLFSLFTFNRYTHDFILNDLLDGVDDRVKEKVSKELKNRVRMDMPKMREKESDTDAPGYDAILSKFHNPFEVVEMFKKHGFKDVKILWYHYHPAMPYLEKEMPELFRKEGIRLERDPHGWRGFFLCSAFVIEAVKGEDNIPK